jgi:hypothetical protein
VADVDSKRWDYRLDGRDVVIDAVDGKVGAVKWQVVVGRSKCAHGLRMEMDC